MKVEITINDVDNDPVLMIRNSEEPGFIQILSNRNDPRSFDMLGEVKIEDIRTALLKIKAK